ncbi:MAG: helix-turn-helix domain-containing protein [Candidatus Paceibacterales bacterium]
MPKITPALARIRATRLVKTLQKKDFNQAAVARELGVTRQNIQSRMNRPEVQRTLDEVIRDNFKKAGITVEKVYLVLAAGLKATKEGDVDFRERREAARLCLELIGHLKRDKIEEAKPTEIHVHYGYRRSQTTKAADQEGA